MLRFNYSSPGKIILFGEHAVVYGYSAVATAITKRIHMKCELTKSSRTEINIIDDGDLFSFNPRNDTLSNHPDRNREKMLRFAFQDFPENHTLNVEIKSEFPTGNGLGSSASFCSLIAAASSRCSNQQMSKDFLYRKSTELEKFFHKNPSGLDPATVVYGGAIKMENRQISKNLSLPQIPLLIIDTFVPRSTAKAVQHVADLLKKNPKIYRPMLEVLGEISDTFEKSDKKEVSIQRYFPIAQNLLSSFDLSCKEIDDVVETAKKAGLVAKLSGAGMGGTVLVSGERAHEKAHLFNRYGVIQSSIGAEGLREE
ncbi:mevalonate kinase family protein [Tritrichomonas foetus]|uniref:Mevalonate kinase n=1 Tax=Tritrichomonas foetus TaxID=1144522 RepID=A0A1J4J773_9EUKA|nr:mevalonate kinase family protein [Tritrichomonas foetus]|eukprot:OHS93293.1 mevalonate kinase family protein [Tritrichomonas foetus]